MEIRKYIYESVKKSINRINIDDLFNYYTSKKELEETNFPSFKIPKRKYGDKVIDCLVDIITTTEGISEKSFNQYDQAIERAKNIVLENERFIEIVKENSDKKNRPELTAEIIFSNL